MTILNVTYVSVWEEGLLSSSAKLDTSTFRVYDIESVESDTDVVNLVSEYIILHNKPYQVDYDYDNGYSLLRENDKIKLKRNLSNYIPVQVKNVWCVGDMPENNYEDILVYKNKPINIPDKELIQNAQNAYGDDRTFYITVDELNKEI